MEDKDRTIKSKQKEIEKLTEDNKKVSDFSFQLSLASRSYHRVGDRRDRKNISFCRNCSVQAKLWLTSQRTQIKNQRSRVANRASSELGGQKFKPRVQISWLSFKGRES